MLVATWNVNGLRARLDFVRHWLDARRPDVVALQELKLEDEQFPHRELAELGYRAAAFGQKSWNGVALLSRVGEPEILQRGLPGREELGARLLSARIGDLEMISVYCPNGKHTGHADYQRKLSWFDALAEHLAARHDPEQALIVGGDFNICPTDLDSHHDPAATGADAESMIFHTEAERSRFRRLLDWGLIDMFRELHPDQRLYSWWDYRGGAFHRNLGLRIDFVLATAPLRERALSARIDRDYRKKKDGLTASDHAPVMVELAER